MAEQIWAATPLALLQSIPITGDWPAEMSATSFASSPLKAASASASVYTLRSPSISMAVPPLARASSV